MLTNKVGNTPPCSISASDNGIPERTRLKTFAYIVLSLGDMDSSSDMILRALTNDTPEATSSPIFLANSATLSDFSFLEEVFPFISSALTRNS